MLLRSCIVSWVVSVCVYGSSCENLFSKFPNQKSAHDSINTDLFNGHVTEAALFRENGNTKDLFKVKMYNPQTGRIRDAIFKPRVFGDQDGYGRMPMEYVAYELNKMLGMDYIPPTAYRKWFNVNGNQYEGAIQFFAPEASLLYNEDVSRWNERREIVVSDSRILNVLLKNPDGHYKNILHGKHWVDGVKRPVFVDFSAALRRGTNVAMDRYHSERNNEKVEFISSSTLQGLKNLSMEKLASLSEFISHKEKKEILRTRDEIILYFEDLIQKNGIEKVVLQNQK